MDMDNDDVDEDFVISSEFQDYPISVLLVTTRTKIAELMDKNGIIVTINRDTADEIEKLNDIIGLAELAGYDYEATKLLKLQSSPTEAFLDQWNSPDATIGTIWQFLYLLKRYDVLRTCKRNILADCRAFHERQAKVRSTTANNRVPVSLPKQTNEETDFVTTEDVLNGKQTLYDAFLCYNGDDDEDRAFVKIMMTKLEVERGLKLFIPGRNDIPGSAKHAINAYIIEKRCRRVLILLSKSFHNSNVCGFQCRFAQALDPDARNRKLIPIIREPGVVIPNILNLVSVCDLTERHIDDGVWDRLETAIVAPTCHVTTFGELLFRRTQSHECCHQHPSEGQSRTCIKQHSLENDEGCYNHVGLPRTLSSAHVRKEVELPTEEYSNVRCEMDHNNSIPISADNDRRLEPCQNSDNNINLNLDVQSYQTSKRKSSSTYNNLGKSSPASKRRHSQDDNSRDDNLSIDCSRINNSQVISSTQDVFSTNTRFHPTATENSYDYSEHDD